MHIQHKTFKLSTLLDLSSSGNLVQLDGKQESELTIQIGQAIVNSGFQPGFVYIIEDCETSILTVIANWSIVEAVHKTMPLALTELGRRRIASTSIHTVILQKTADSMPIEIWSFTGLAKSCQLK